MTGSQKTFPHTTALDAAVLLIVSASLVLPIFVWGVPFGNDLPQHFQFAQQFERTLADGSLYPGWAADPNSGYGDVGVRFYPPFAYYVLVTLKNLAGSWHLGAVFTFLFLFFVSGLGARSFAAHYLDRSSALTAAIFFLVMPYHVNQIYNAFLYAEFAGTAILPFCFLFAARVIDRGKVVDLLALSASYGLLILTHLPLTVIGSLALLAFCLTSLSRQRLFGTVSSLGIAVGIALAATSFYWLRVATEFSLVKVTGTEFTQQQFDFRSNFLLSGIFGSWENYAERSLLFIDAMLVLSIAVGIAGALLYRSRNGRFGKLCPVFILLALSVLLTVPLSYPIWANFDALARVQFPWRWLALISLLAAVLAASGGERLAELFRSDRRPLALILAGIPAIVIAFTLAQVIRPAIYIPPEAFGSRVEKLRKAESCECLWPATANRLALAQTQPVSAGGRSIEVSDWSSVTRIFTVAPGPPTNARVATFYYPHWKATLNGQPVGVNAGANGEIVFALPEGSAAVELSFIEPWFLRVATWVSLMTWILLLLGLLAWTAKSRFSPEIVKDPA